MCVTYKRLCRLSIRPSVRPSVRPSIRPSVCTYVRRSGGLGGYAGWAPTADGSRHSGVAKIEKSGVVVSMFQQRNERASITLLPSFPPASSPPCFLPSLPSPPSLSASFFPLPLLVSVTDGTTIIGTSLFSFLVGAVSLDVPTIVRLISFVSTGTGYQEECSSQQTLWAS